MIWPAIISAECIQGIAQDSQSKIRWLICEASGLVFVRGGSEDFIKDAKLQLPAAELRNFQHNEHPDRHRMVKKNGTEIMFYSSGSL